MDILDVLIYFIFFSFFVLNLIAAIIKFKAKRAKGKPLVSFKRRFIKIPRELYYYVHNVEVASEKPDAERLTSGLDYPRNYKDKNITISEDLEKNNKKPDNE